MCPALPAAVPNHHAEQQEQYQPDHPSKAEHGRTLRNSDLAGLPGLLDVVGGLPQDLGDPLQGGVVGAAAPGALEGGAREPGEGSLHLTDAATGEVSHRLPDPVDDLIQQVAVLLEVPLALE